MNKKEFVGAVMSESGTELSRKQVQDVLDAAFSTVSSAVASGGRFAYL